MSEHAAAAAAGLPVRLETALDVPFEIELAVVLEDGQFQFNPIPYLGALAGAVIANGGAVYERSRVVGLTSERGQPVVVTGQGRVRARRC